MRGLTTPLFCVECYGDILFYMEKERLKLIVRNLELLVDSLKAEIFSDVDAYTDKRENYDDHPESKYGDYDEIYNDDDGYPD
jgi:hypothetical protein